MHLRVRLWYGPAGHDLGLDRVARYLRGPLACDVGRAQRRQQGRWIEQLDLIGPVPAALHIVRHPDVAIEAADMARRLPPAAPAALARRLGGCTARLDIHDAPGAGPFLPTTGLARSVLFPLAYAMDGYVEEVETGRVFYHPRPGDLRHSNALRRALRSVIRALRR